MQKIFYIMTIFFYVALVFLSIKTALAAGFGPSRATGAFLPRFQEPDMNRILALAITAAIAVTPAAGAFAQETPPGYKTLDMRDDASSWIKDPHVHEFYQATVDAFARGPDHLDRAAFNKRFKEIFDDFAVSRHIPPKAMADHLKRIPGETILIVTRDPKTLDSYDNFVVALFGPQG